MVNLRCDELMIAVGNWKLSHTIPEVRQFFSRWRQETVPAEVQVGFAVPYTAIDAARAQSAGLPVTIGAQNCSMYDRGSYTGEVSAEMVADAGADFVILGHNERRTLFHESLDDIRQKVSRAVEAGLQIVLCCGENAEERAAGRGIEIIVEQIRSAVEGLEVPRLWIAYEPAWAIGAGDAADSDTIMETLFAVKEGVSSFLKEPLFLYGGSVTPDNVAAVTEHSIVSGVLVGRISTDPTKFASLVRNMRARP